jgi:hypothetical protein
MGSNCGPLSSTLQRHGMTAAQAERFLATTWCILEERGLATPQMAVRQAGALIDISLSFSSAEDCALIERKFIEIL